MTLSTLSNDESKLFATKSGSFTVIKSPHDELTTTHALTDGQRDVYLKAWGTFFYVQCSTTIQVAIELDYFEGERSGNFVQPGSRNRATYYIFTDVGQTSFPAKRGTFTITSIWSESIRGQFQFVIDYEGSEMTCEGFFDIYVELK